MYDGQAQTRAFGAFGEERIKDNFQILPGYAHAFISHIDNGFITTNPHEYAQFGFAGSLFHTLQSVQKQIDKNGEIALRGININRNLRYG